MAGKLQFLMLRKTDRHMPLTESGRGPALLDLWLWVGKDEKGNPVQCWIPDRVPSEVFDAGVSEFESHRPVNERGPW